MILKQISSIFILVLLYWQPAFSLYQEGTDSLKAGEWWSFVSKTPVSDSSIGDFSIGNGGFGDTFYCGVNINFKSNEVGNAFWGFTNIFNFDSVIFVLDSVIGNPKNQIQFFAWVYDDYLGPTIDVDTCKSLDILELNRNVRVIKTDKGYGKIQTDYGRMYNGSLYIYFKWGFQNDGSKKFYNGTNIKRGDNGDHNNNMGVNIRRDFHNDQLIISLPKSYGMISFGIFDLKGNVVKTNNLYNQTQFILSLKGFQSGIYIVLINSEDGRLIRKILVGGLHG